MYLMILAEEAGIPAGRELDVVTEGLLFDKECWLEELAWLLLLFLSDLEDLPVDLAGAAAADAHARIKINQAGAVQNFARQKKRKTKKHSEDSHL